MLSKEELLGLISDPESDRVEKTISVSDTGKFSEAICAFANNFSNDKKPGYLIIGVYDKNSSLCGLKVTDELLKNLAAIRNDGQILPQPSITVQRYVFEGGEVAVVEVFPSMFPPVRYKGRVWIRNGPSKAIANEAEERILTEKRTSSAKTFDATPVWEAEMEDLNIEYFKANYLPNAIDSETLESNHRDFLQQLSSLRMYDLVNNLPTNAGILLFGTNPLFYLPGCYIHYIKFKGTDMEPEPIEKKFSGPLVSSLQILDDFIKYNIIEESPRRENSLKEKTVFNYPYWAIRELLMNAIMHRNYESNAPIYIYHFTDRIEIINPGGLYGEARPENFPNANDYRNPILAEALKVLGYVNRFNFGVRHAQKELELNGNPPAQFELGLVTKFQVKIQISQTW
jgi:ATP-dependent DNA helicase RecG